MIAAFLLITFVYFRWSSAIRQPLEFSHAQHVKKQIVCSTCHVSAQLEQLPAALECRECHADKSFPAEVQWIRVYRIAPDIIFRHANHSSVPCSTCHEEFTEADRWIHESRFKMSFCMDCHEERRAPNECRTCHTNKK